ncbi:hypothetical protein AHAT_07600 [Agarivorans sp. Toyoura001]|uniref:hypothetical protein n=1 Tax=Agarivorans sp. Toyoura001 TaxID=2283141 RepID=UPI0010DC5EB5|nr:hypothetical protein [Agarivorans sp. Toyoura001]GDY24870.1 hypothetical protein AHAT_07600 [Agarivorans sp. Toyoura001]
MKKTLLALSIVSLSTVAMAEDNVANGDVNYGDPTATFSSVGVSRSSDRTQLNSTFGWGAGNMIFADLGAGDKKDAEGKIDYDYRLRYFKVNDGLGYSVDVMGDRNTTTAMAGGMYKFDVTNNISLFPMLYGGYMSSKVEMQTDDGKEKFKDSTLVQAGLYAMYAFDDGHWLYANPKATYITRAKDYVPQIEVGGGYMVLDNVSVGFKVEHTADSKVSKKDTVTWLQASMYF